MSYKCRIARGIFFAIVVTFLLLAVGYAQEKAPGSASAIKPMTLRVNYHGAEAVFSRGINLFAGEVTKRTGGQVKFDLFWMGALGGIKEQVKNLGGGLFDMTLLVPGYYPGDLPLYSVLTLPLLSSDFRAMARASTELSRMPELEKELEKVNIKNLFCTSATSYEYMGTKLVQKPEDFKGLKLRVTGEHAWPIQEMGATPINIGPTETAMAIERGTIDGVILPYTSFNPYGIHEVSKHACFYNQGTNAYLMAMNLNTWKKLQPEVRQIMLDAIVDVIRIHSQALEEEGVSHIEVWKKKGIKIYEMSPQDKARIADSVGPAVWNIWIKKMEDKGLPGRKVLAAFRDKLTK